MTRSGYKMTIGSKAQVWHGTAKHTSGGLKKSDLMKTKHGRIVSIKKHNLGKKMAKRNRLSQFRWTKRNNPHTNPRLRHGGETSAAMPSYTQTMAPAMPMAYAPAWPQRVAGYAPVYPAYIPYH